MESKNESEQKNQIKKKIRNFFRGCQSKKCLNFYCKNSIIKSEELEAYRDKEKEGLSYIIKKIGENDFRMSCVVKPFKEEIQKYEKLFNFDFQEFLNIEEEQEKEKLLSEIEESIKEIDKLEDKMKSSIFQKLNNKLKNTLEDLEILLTFNVFDYEFLVSFVKFLLCFNRIFEIENFSNFDNFQKMLQNLEFKKLFKISMKAKFHDLLINKNNYEKLIEFLQNTSALTIMMKNEENGLNEFEVYLLKAIYNVFGFLFSINKLLKKNLKLKIEEFQNDEVVSKIEGRQEIMQLVFYSLKKTNPNIAKLLEKMMKFEKSLHFRFINYPFIFTVPKKVDFLRYESKLLQQMELQKLFRDPLSLLQIGSSGLFLELNLRRNNILEDTLKQLHQKGKGSNLQKNLRINFIGEPGVDQGGLTKEFFQLLTERLFNPEYGMFITKNDRFLWFNHDSFESSMNFEMVGILLGLALYNSTILEIKFPLVIYKKLKIGFGDFIEDEIILDDLAEFEPELHTSFSNLLKNDFSKEESNLFFNISYQSWGENKSLNLIENGEKVPVTEENKHKFVELYLDWYFNTSIEKQFRPFYKGFFMVLTGDIIHLFNHYELFLAICGSTHLDFSELKSTTVYEGYTENSETIQHFWKILLNDFNDEMKKDFLRFLTGSDRAPLRGLSDIRMKISRHGEVTHLPSAHTCFNILVLPDYQNFEILKGKLMKSLENSEGFGLL